MGYHTQSDIPNYWTYAHDFVLQDHMFEPNASWSLPAHLFMVSEWSARLHAPQRPVDAAPTRSQSPGPARASANPRHSRSRADLRVDRPHLPPAPATTCRGATTSCTGTEPDCENDRRSRCAPVRQNCRTPGIWNPLPVLRHRPQRRPARQHPVRRTTSTRAAQARHAARGVVGRAVRRRQRAPAGPDQRRAAYVTSLINAVMRGPDWNSTAIFLAWDDWGGFYDHVAPPKVDQNGYGLRVPGDWSSAPTPRRGYIDHQTLSFDAYAKFIEDDFLDGQRLDPKPTVDPTPDPPSARTSRSSATSPTTSTSTKRHARPSYSPSIPRPRSSAVDACREPVEPAVGRPDGESRHASVPAIRGSGRPGLWDACSGTVRRFGPASV